MSSKEEHQVLWSTIDLLSEQLSEAVVGNLDLALQADLEAETLERLQKLVNFVLDSARQALAESHAKTRDLARANEDLQAEIEEHRRTEQRLQVSEYQSRAIVDAAAEGIVTINELGIIQSYNRAAQRIFGYPGEEVVGQNISMLMPLPHREGHDTYLRNYFTSHVRHVIGTQRELAGRRKDGSVVPIDLHVSEVEVGQRTVFTGIVRDITQRKLAEEALRAEKEYTENIIRSLIDMLVVIVPDGRIARVNQALCASLGFSEQELVGRPVKELLSATSHELGKEEEEEDSSFPLILPKDALPIGCEALRRLAREGRFSGLDACLATRDGQELPVLVSGSVMRDRTGETVGIICIAQDLTERKRIDMERKGLEIELVHARQLESVGQLAAGIAHEINTPTQYVGDNIRFLQEAFEKMLPLLETAEQLAGSDGADPMATELAERLTAALERADVMFLREEVPQAIGQSLDGVERMSRIVQAMKEFSHPGAPEITGIDINRAIESTITVATNEWKYVADMNMDLAADLPAVPCLPGEFNQVILNIVVNAAHAIADMVGDGSQGKGTIRVSTHLDGDSVEIRVQDSGIGIPEEARPRVFDPFYTTKEVGKGTGQGLSIAHAVVVQKHGGTIHFETEDGEGTTFVIRLPLEQKRAACEETLA